MVAASLENDERPATVTRRRTKIVATLGPVSRDVRVLEQLLDAGMDVARINLSHGSTAHSLGPRFKLRQDGPLSSVGAASVSLGDCLQAAGFLSENTSP